MVESSLFIGIGNHFEPNAWLIGYVKIGAEIETVDIEGTIMYVDTNKVVADTTRMMLMLLYLLNKNQFASISLMIII